MRWIGRVTSTYSINSFISHVSDCVIHLRPQIGSSIRDRKSTQPIGTAVVVFVPALPPFHRSLRHHLNET